MLNSYDNMLKAVTQNLDNQIDIQLELEMIRNKKTEMLEIKAE